ncbi:hypothetical protein HZS_1959 [Henneguya salminicola]|nr:hypothetical protein HZS_1959 [Henneguya salminicola]
MQIRRKLFQNLFVEIDFIQEITDLINYFEETFVGGVRRGTRTTPLFPIEIWNIHGRLSNNFNKKNNSVEGWHRAFSRMVGSDHVNIYTILKNILLEQNNTENLIT